MNKVTNSTRRRKAANLPLFLLAGAAAVTAEALTFALLWRSEPDHVVGVLYSVLTCAFSLAGIVLSGEAARRKADPRPGVRRVAGAAALVAWLCIVPSSVIGGGAMAQKIQTRSAEEYAGSAAYQETLRISQDESADDHVRAQAALDLERAIKPTQARIDGAWISSVIAFFAILALPLMAVKNGLAFMPETPAQMKARLKAQAAAKRAKTLKQKAQQKPVKLRLVS